MFPHRYSTAFLLGYIFTSFISPSFSEPTAPPSPSPQREQQVTKDVEPVSHHATYSVEFICSPDSEFAHASGAMTMEIVRFDNNWIMKQTSSLTLEIPGSDDRETTSTILTSLEDHEGLNYHFTAQAMRDGVVEETIEGKARLTGEGGAGTAVYVQPEAMTVHLPQGTIFPIKHMKLLLSKSKKIPYQSLQIIKFNVFDGSSDVREAVRIDAIVVPVDPKKKSVQVSNSSIVMPDKLWRAEMAIYNITNTSNDPDYKLIQVFSEQGIVFEMIADYGDYKMVSKLTDLKIFTDDTAQKVLRMK